MSSPSKTKTCALGFTLIEVILSVAIFTIVAGISAPLFGSVQQKYDLDLTTIALAHNLRQAQLRARAMSGDSSWGVAIENSNIILFQGDNFAERQEDADITTEFPASITVYTETPDGVVFAKLSGKPASAASYTLSVADDTRTVFIDQAGMVTYE